MRGLRCAEPFFGALQHNHSRGLHTIFQSVLLAKARDGRSKVEQRSRECSPCEATQSDWLVYHSQECAQSGLGEGIEPGGRKQCF